MAINVIYGANGSGKTNKLLGYVDPNKNNLFITADAAVNYIEQRMTSMRILGKCVGINMFPSFLSREISGVNCKIMSREEQIILIGKIISENSSRLQAFGESTIANGMLDRVFDFIDDCNYSGISAQELIASKKIGSNPFGKKVDDIALIMDEMQKYMTEHKYVSSYDMYSVIADKITGENSLGRYDNIIIDSLDKYPVQFISFLKQMLKQNMNIAISFIYVNDNEGAYEYFRDEYDVGQDIFKYISSETSILANREVISTEIKNDTAINAIKKGYFSGDIQADSSDDIEIFGASTMEKEADFVAAKIKGLIKEGYKPADITIASTTIDSYIVSLEAALSRVGVKSYFYKASTLEKSDVFRFLKQVFLFTEDKENADHFCSLINFPYLKIEEDEKRTVARFFIRFGNNIPVALQNGMKYDADNYTIVKGLLEKVESEIALFDTLDNNVKTIINTIMTFFMNIDITKTLSTQAKVLAFNKETVTARAINASWDSLMKILQCIYNVYENTPLSFSEFKMLLDKCAEDTTVTDNTYYHNYVPIIRASEVRNQKNKVLFVLGCNEGKLPMIPRAQLINDEEKNIIIKTTGKKLKTSVDRLNYNIATTYLTITIPSEKVFLSWAYNENDGKKLFPATAINTIVRAFPEKVLEEKNIYNEDEENRFIELLKGLSKYKNTGKKSNELDAEYLYFMTHRRYAKRLNKAVQMILRDRTKINSTNVNATYTDNDFFAITRLEKFGSCPFRHFIDYGIKPSPIKIFDESAADKGNLYHEIMRQFFSWVKSNNIDIKGLTQQNVEEKVQNIMSTLVETHNENILNSSNKFTYIALQMQRRAVTSVWNAVVQLQKGKFVVTGNEYRVGKDIAMELTLDDGVKKNIVGTIDRFDICDISGNQYVRIVDYKSGNTTFSNDKLEDGVQLQLPLYLKAMSTSYAPAGMYYYHIADPVVDIDESNDSIEKNFQMTGITLADRAVCTATDDSLDLDGSKSTVVSVEITSKGEFSKRSKLMEQEALNGAMDKAVSMAKDSIQRIEDGETKAYPYMYKEENACKYCSYKSICHFNPHKKGAYRKHIDAK